MQVLLDCGAVQSDALTVDCRASLEQVHLRIWKNFVIVFLSLARMLPFSSTFKSQSPYV